MLRAVGGLLRVGPVCGPHKISVYAAHGHLIDRVERLPEPARAGALDVALEAVSP